VKRVTEDFRFVHNRDSTKHSQARHHHGADQVLAPFAPQHPTGSSIPSLCDRIRGSEHSDNERTGKRSEFSLAKLMVGSTTYQKTRQNKFQRISLDGGCYQK